MIPKIHQAKKLPASFRPLLWSFRWGALDVNADKADIIVNTINEGTLKQWHWLIHNYGARAIKRVLQKRVASEFHPESLNLARVMFHLKPLPHAR